MSIRSRLADLVARVRRPRRPVEVPAGDADGFDGPDLAEPVVIPIEDSIDLHYFPPSDVGELVDAYLEAAAERGFREVRIIHGRGRGVQRERVRRHLARSPLVERFADAPGDRGGWGATLAWLRAASGGSGEAAQVAPGREEGQPEGDAGDAADQ